MFRPVLIIIAFGVVVFGSACSTTSENANGAMPEEPVVSQFENISDPVAAIAEGDRLLDENETESAIEAYKRAITLNPDLPDAYFKLGIAYGLLERQAELTGQILPPAETNGDEKGGPPKKDSEKAFENAVEAYKKWLTANPDDHAARFNLGRTYNKLYKDEEAEKEFRAAVKLNPDDSEYQTELGSILIKLAKYREAIGPLKRALELDPENDRAAIMLEDAEAGRQRVDYVPPKKDANLAANNSNTATTEGEDSNSNAALPTTQRTTNTNVRPTPHGQTPQPPGISRPRVSTPQPAVPKRN